MDFQKKKLEMFVLCTQKGKKCICCEKNIEYIPLSTWYEREYLLKSRSETLSKQEYLCPVCGATDRDRLIIAFLKRICLNKEKRLLQFAPTQAIESYILSEHPDVIYHSADLFMKNVTFTLDIQEMCELETESYDYFICSHVLEHVQDDKKAMKELYRILKTEGIGIFLVPLDLNVEKTDEEWGLSEEENWKRFGQGDHCRNYAKRDLLTRLCEVGFFIYELGKTYFGENIYTENGLTDTATFYILRKCEKGIEWEWKDVNGRTYIS